VHLVVRHELVGPKWDCIIMGASFIVANICECIVLSLCVALE
jgi:hypothetical protein